MDNFDASVIYQLAVDRHRETIARGEAAQARGASLDTSPPRIRPAAVLLALVRRIGPAAKFIAPDRAPVAPTTVH